MSSYIIFHFVTEHFTSNKFLTLQGGRTFQFQNVTFAQITLIKPIQPNMTSEIRPLSQITNSSLHNYTYNYMILKSVLQEATSQYLTLTFRIPSIKIGPQFSFQVKPST